MDNSNDNLFLVSVKGLFFNEEGKLLMIQEDNGNWEFPGGRIQKGEQFMEALKRECKEEMGLVCEVLDNQPCIIYSAVDDKDRGRVMVFYKVKFNSLDFKPSEECVEIKFFTKDEIGNLQKPQTLKSFTSYIK